MAAAHQAVASATKTSFRMANVCYCVVEQQALLNAQQMLKSQKKALRLPFLRAFKKFISRCFQTTYGVVLHVLSNKIKSTNLT